MSKQKEEFILTDDERKQINKQLKAHNRYKGSKYIKPKYSIFGYSYNDSMKSPIDLELIKEITEEDVNKAAEQVLIK